MPWLWSATALWCSRLSMAVDPTSTAWRPAVIRAVLACTRMSVLQALRWYDQQPIPGHGKTPVQLVAKGRVDAVMNHLSRLRSEDGGDA